MLQVSCEGPGFLVGTPVLGLRIEGLGAGIVENFVEKWKTVLRLVWEGGRGMGSLPSLLPSLPPIGVSPPFPTLPHP